MEARAAVAPAAIKVSFWRPLLLAVCLCSVAVNAYTFATHHIEASSALGYTAERTRDPALVRIQSVDAGGAAAASGLRVGDLIELRALSAPQRYRLLTGVFPHERIPVVLLRSGRVYHVTFVAGDAPPLRWDTWGAYVSSFWMLAFALLIAWKRADIAEGRVLCLLFALANAGAALQTGSWIGPSPFADLVTACAAQALLYFSSALLATYALLFGRPISRARYALTAVAYACALGLALDTIVRLVLLWNGDEAWVAQSFGPDWNFFIGGLPYATALLCALVAIRPAQGLERSRIAWAVASLGPLYLLQVTGPVMPLLASSAQRGNALLITYAWYNVGSILAPIGLTYLLFKRRLLDIGFALNRLAIFSTVSIIIVGTFVLAEWAFGVWLQSASHAANLLAQAGLALVLGLSIRFVHLRVDYVLDRVFFRKRHEDEQAIRRFSHEAGLMTDRDELIARTITVLEGHAGASFARLLLDDGAGQFGGISENDPAILALRTWGRVLDLHGIETRISGEFAYPMIARGRMTGALVLGPKTSQENYAPDESQAISELAHALAGALEMLPSHQPREDGIIAELRALRTELARGFAALDVQRRTPSGGR